MATRTAVEQKAQKLFRVVDSVKAKIPVILQKTSRFSGIIFAERRSYTSTNFDLLPPELQIEILHNCRYQDLLNLRLTSRAFKTLIDANENAIIRNMLVAYDYNTLSELFPPPKNHSGEPRYSIKYIHLLHKRHCTCSGLAYHLAYRAVNSALRGPPRRERKELAEIAIQKIQASLTTQLYHVYRFLSHTYLSLESAKAALALEYDNLIEDIDLWNSYQQIQVCIISALPDTVLISTHHAMTFLVNTIRLCICPEPPYNQNDAMVSLLLRSHSSFKRILEFFQADSRGTSRNLRKNFMIAMQKEKDEEAEKRTPIPKMRPPKLRETWFEVAQKEMIKRKLQGHEPELYSFNGFPNVRIGCPMCHDG